jgi:hypothetical protein
LLQAGKAIERVGAHAAVAAGEGPTILGEIEVGGDQLDDGFEGLEATDNDGAMGLAVVSLLFDEACGGKLAYPGTTIVSIECIPIFVRRKLRTRFL